MLQSSWVQLCPNSTLRHDMGIHHPESRKLGECAGFADLSNSAVSCKNKSLLFYVL